MENEIFTKSMAKQKQKIKNLKIGNFSNLLKILSFSVLLFSVIGITIYFASSDSVLPGVSKADAEEIDLGALIVMGDSISVGYGASGGQSYAQLLKDRLEFDAGNIRYFNVADGGAKAEDLASQGEKLINKIDDPIEGHTIVAMTIGGNDLQAAYKKEEDIDQIMSGVMSDIENLARFFEQNSAVFPDGVSIFVSNVYDPTDGTGKARACTLKATKGETDRLFTSSNAGFASLESAGLDIYVVDAYNLFLGHGAESNNESGRGGVNSAEFSGEVQGASTSGFKDDEDLQNTQCEGFFCILSGDGRGFGGMFPEIDISGIFSSGEYWYSDCGHPNGAGHTALGNEFYNRVNEIYIITAE